MSLDHYEGVALDALSDLASVSRNDDSIRLQAAQVILQHVQYKGHLSCYNKAKDEAEDGCATLFGIRIGDVAGIHPMAAGEEVNPE